VAVAFVDAVVVVVPEDRIVAVLSAVVERILDSLRERLGFRDAKHANPDDHVTEITAAIANDLDVVARHPRLMVNAPSKYACRSVGRRVGQALRRLRAVPGLSTPRFRVTRVALALPTSASHNGLPGSRERSR